ncbi:MAG: hypothetical protein IT260_22455 [Saprospiraceae bacterium]|nr:hypothetical protein [Saprospiraceae bacterium]
MNRYLPGIFMAALFVLGAAMPVSAQSHPTFDSLTLVLVSTKDGNEFIGTIITQTEEKVVLQTSTFGELSIQRKMIFRMRATEPEKIVNGKIWYRNPHAPRHFAGPSAYGLQKGEGSYDNTFLFFNQVSYGLSDHFSLGLGLAPMILFDGPFPVWLTPKFSIPIAKNKLNLAVGGLYGHAYSSYEFDDKDFAAVFSQITLGTRDANISAGMAFVTTDNQLSKAKLLSINGMVRAGSWISLIAESYISVDGGEDSVSLLGLGIRFMGRRIAFDGGLTFVREGEDDTYPIPWASLHVPFGRSKK